MTAKRTTAGVVPLLCLCAGIASAQSSPAPDFDAAYAALNAGSSAAPRPTLSAGPPAPPPWRFEALPPAERVATAAVWARGAVDDTAALVAAYQSAKFAANATPPDGADKTCYLLLRGMAFRLDREHFQAMRARFAARGLCVEVVDGPIDANFGQSAPKIAEAIERHPSVVLIGHSKGGLNALQTVSLAYQTNDTNLTSRVRAIVTIQTPYACAPTADWWLHIPGGVYNSIVGVFHWWTQGRQEIPSHDTVSEVSCTQRNAPPPMPLPPGVKLYSIATSFPVEVPGVAGPAAVSRALYVKKATDEDSDGYVTPGRGIVPGSHFALLDRLTHTDLVTSDPNVYAQLWSVGRDPELSTRLFPDALLAWISRD